MLAEKDSLLQYYSREEMDLTQEQKLLLIEFERVGIVLFGETIRKKYGLNSPIYLDLREKLYERADLMWRIGSEFAGKIRSLAENHQSRQVVIGVPDTATPLAVSTVLNSTQTERDQPLHYLLLRKKAKAYNSVSPSYVLGKKHCDNCEYTLIDDVMASGLSKWKSIEKLKGEGISIQRIIVFFDRQQGGSELLQEEGYQVYSIFKLLDVIAFYLEKGLISPATHSQIHEFLLSHRFERPLWRG